MNNPLTQLWIGRCDIYEYQPTVNPITKLSVHELVTIASNEPCRISHNKEQATNIQNGAAVVSQSITLFVRPDLVVPAGCVIEVTQHGRTTKYRGSSKSALYTNHQEIILELYEDNA